MNESKTMPDERRCPDCGAALPADAPSGLCVKCLLAIGVAGAGGSAQVPSIQEQEAQRIGRYKLLEKIGTGGFGDVWMAEQEEPVRRRVALKIIKLGMDTKEVIARFEAERQALALMDQVTERTIEAWMRNGSVVFYKIGRTVRFRWADPQAHWDAVCRVAPRTRARSSTLGRRLEIGQRNGHPRNSCRGNHVARMQEE